MVFDPRTNAITGLTDVDDDRLTDSGVQDNVDPGLMKQ